MYQTFVPEYCTRIMLYSLEFPHSLEQFQGLEKNFTTKKFLNGELHFAAYAANGEHNLRTSKNFTTQKNS